MTATGVTWAYRLNGPDIEVSKFGFNPIDQVGHCQRTIWSAAPVAVCRERGVDLGPYQKAELAEYMDAGPRGGEAARLVRAQILERRGGVLPHNWNALERYKANVDLMAQIRDRSGDSDGD